jgi:hypothetical protein
MTMTTMECIELEHIERREALRGHSSFWIWLADQVHHAPQFADWPREQLDDLALLLRAESSRWGAH